jgi:predicted Zn-dependent protease with MMP-like domain
VLNITTFSPQYAFNIKKCQGSVLLKDMVQISEEDFEKMIENAIDHLPKDHAKQIKNVAITWADDPTPEQRIRLELRHDQTLFGLYEGVPLSHRQGGYSQIPDRITLFKGPLCMSVNDMTGLKEQINHTLWHEVAHYFGLNHTQIHELE